MYRIKTVFVLHLIKAISPLFKEGKFNMALKGKLISKPAILNTLQYLVAVILWIGLMFSPLTSWSIDSNYSGYKVDFEESYGKGHSPITGSLIHTSDGGYAFAGTWGSSFAAWLVKTDDKGVQEWEQTFRANKTTSWQRATVVLPARDGGYLLGGESNELDLVGSQWDDKINPREMNGRPKTALVTKFDKDGKVVWKKIYGRLGKYFAKTIYQGIAVEDGFIFLGIGQSDVTDQPTPTGIVTIRTLWLFKISVSGEMLWEKTFAEDDGEYLKPSTSGEHYSKLVVDKDGEIVFATAIEEIFSEMRDGKRVLGLRGFATGPRKKILVIKLDKNGNESTRARLTFGVGPTLLVTDDGFHLLDNEAAKDRTGIRSIQLDKNLKVISEHVIPAKNFWIRSAVSGPIGGLHLAGYHRTPPNERGEAAVAYLSKEGELKHEKLFGINSWPADIVPGTIPAEVELLWFGGMREAAWLTKIKLAD